MKKIVFSLFLLINSICFSYINLYPLKFEKNIAHGAGEEFTLYNRTTKTVKYRVYIEEVEGKKSMADWVEVYPKSVTLTPLKEDTLRLYVQAPKGTPEGEYQANLVIKEISLPLPEADKEDREKKTKILTMVKLRLKGIVDYE